VRIAVLDQYCGHVNQGMRCIEAITKAAGLEIDHYDVRGKGEVPKVKDYRFFLSTGGPGDPHEVESESWGKPWGSFLEELLEVNKGDEKRFAFLICHSYQMACIHWGLAEVTRRRKPAFGIYPMNRTEAGAVDSVLEGLPDPFWVIDSRDWQVVQPHVKAMDRFGAKVLAIERDRPHVRLERAAMAIRFTPEIVGTQFHPEADESSMQAYIDDPAMVEQLAGKHGLDRIEKIKENLGDLTKVQLTHTQLLPNFLRVAMSKV